MKREYGKRLSDWTSFKIGGPAFCWLEPENFDDILEAVSEAEANDKPVSIIGRGTNVLVQDTGFHGIVINLGKDFDYLKREEEGIVNVGAGTPISRLVKQSVEWGLGGCEFLSGIPGSFGGAVFMNAGVHDGEVKDIIFDVDLLDLKDRKRKTVKREGIDFKYRSSGLEGKYILGARVKLHKDTKSSIIELIDLFMKKREWLNSLGYPTAGSVFKNPNQALPAGKLIEACGLKGTRIGGAEISKHHANFIMNIGDATSKDVLDLIEIARDRVKERFGVELELELKVI